MSLKSKLFEMENNLPTKERPSLSKKCCHASLIEVCKNKSLQKTHKQQHKFLMHLTMHVKW